MRDIDAVAVLAATVVAFVLSGAWCAALGDRLAAVSPLRPQGTRPGPSRPSWPAPSSS